MRWSKNMLSSAFAIQQLSLAAMHPIQTKHYNIIQLLHAGWQYRRWQGYSCICVCVGGPTFFSCLGLNTLVQPVCVFIALSSPHPRSPCLPTHCSISAFCLPVFISFPVVILQPPGQFPTAGIFTADLFFTPRSNWIMHSSIKSPSLKRTGDGFKCWGEHIFCLQR